MPTWIKICGTTSVEDALTSVSAGADALGFIFAPSARRILPDRAREISVQLPGNIERVGVFVNESPEHIRAIVEQVSLTAVQLHGEETPEFIACLFPQGERGRRVGVIKTILAEHETDGTDKNIGKDKNEEFERKLALFCGDRSGVDSILIDSGSGSTSPSAAASWAGPPSGGTRSTS